jgi:hypothetical protein
MKTVKVIALSALVIGAFCFGKSLSTVEVKIVEYPELNAAKRSLMDGKAHLDKAAKDFGGHRSKAADYTDKAIKEVDEAVLYGDKQK